ncbi:hypothetical protein LOK49_LG05G02969 [Camellia lanceoleosa]|uniref:Uncharacterized protein n=1 Tax=Camellia lanceoleosa TaxID=1840588 RepID=A0ACC0HRF2_9ERIC|nr:hypothetical protein LOK49_LG05G02969 [Camellia lanceoleosa]
MESCSSNLFQYRAAPLQTCLEVVIRWGGGRLQKSWVGTDIPTDTGMNTGTRITGGEVAAEAGVDVIVTGTGEGKEIIVIEAGAAAEVLIMTIAVGEADMIMRGVVGAVLIKRSPSPHKTPPSRGGSPDGRNHKERSRTPKSVSLRGRPADSRSPFRHSDADE